MSGFIVAGYCLAAFIFNFVAKAIVNPNNAKPTIKSDENGIIVNFYSSDVANNVPMMFQILAFCWLVMGYVGISIINVPEEMMKKDANLKSTHIELHNLYNDQIKSETSIRFHDRHTYVNNLYFGWGGLIRIKSSDNVEGQEITKNKMSERQDEHKIEMQFMEEQKKIAEQMFSSGAVPNRPITLKHKKSDDVHKMMPFHNENNEIELDTHDNDKS